MNLRFLRLGILPVLFLFSSCGSTDRKEQAQQQQRGAGGPGGQRGPVRADAITVAPTTVTERIEVPGTIAANEATEIHPEVAGRITSISFREGSQVAKGATLFKLNDADLRAQLQKLLVQERIARQSENRSESLLKIGGISRQDYEATQLQVSNTSADIAIIREQISRTVVRAPFSGKVGLRMVSLGAYVSPTTVLTTISQTGQMKIDFTVPEKYIPQLKNGQFINFTIEGNNRNYTARVMATESNISETTRTLQARAIVQGDNTDLTPGAFARVTLTFEPDPNAIVVPTQAVVPKARGKSVFLYRDGVAKAVDVTTGIRDSATVQVTSGLKVGDTVLTTGLLSVRPDGKVSLAKVNGKAVPRQQQPGADSTKKAN